MSGFPEVGGNVIMVIRDRATKYTILIPVSKSLKAEDMADIFFDEVAVRFGLPRQIVPDRGSKYTRFLGGAYQAYGVRRGLSTAYHPQTDGQTERANMDVQAYLRAFVYEKQNDWPHHLKLAQYVINNAVHSIIGISPNMALMGYEIPFPAGFVKKDGQEVISRAALQRAENLLQVRDVALKCHESALEDMKRFADKHRETYQHTRSEIKCSYL